MKQHTDIATWLETRRVTLPPTDESTIIGVGHALDAMRSVLARLRHPVPGADLPRGILLTGPAGVGKTTVARTAGSIGDLPAYDLPPDTLSPRRIRETFAHLGTQPRVLLFLPEADAVGLSRDWGGHDPSSRRTLFALLEGLDGLQPLAPDRGPIVIATSNRPVRAFDPALVRAGRLGLHIVFELPEAGERIALLELFFRNRPMTGLDVRYLAEVTGGWSPAALRALADDAHGSALARGGPDEPITAADALLAVQRGSVRERERDPELSAADRHRSAVHEAGHAAVAIRLGQVVSSIRIAISGLEGRTEIGREGSVPDDRALRASVVIALGGSAAERVLIGEPSLGGAADIRTATSTLLARIGAGIDPGCPPTDRSAWGDYAPRVVDEMLAEHVLGILDHARDEAAQIVVSERDAIARLARTLINHPVLAGEALTDALAEAGLTSSIQCQKEEPHHGPAQPVPAPPRADRGHEPALSARQ